MKFDWNATISIIADKTYTGYANITHLIAKRIQSSGLVPRSRLFATLIGTNSTARTVKIPSWIDSPAPEVKRAEKSELLVDSRPRPLAKVRSFRLNQLTTFNPNPYKLIKPINKNPVLKHLWKLRVNSTYRQGSPKRLVLNESVVRHILSHTEAKFDVILTTSRDLVHFVLSNTLYRARCSRIQLVQRYTLQYCLRGTTHSYHTADTIAEAYVPEQSLDLSPRYPAEIMTSRLVVAFDNVKYTHNLGSLIRTSLALGVDLLYYLKGTTDPFNWKVSAITGGLQYSIPHRYGTPRDLRRFCKENDLVPVVADLEGESLEELRVPGKGVCLILGNESEGPTPEVFKFAKRVALSMHPFTNSLNVAIAGAILIHQIRPLIPHSIEC